VQGWRTANVALVAGIAPPEKLFEVDRRRVVGLCIEPQNLIIHRQKRQAELGMPRAGSAYTDPKRVFEEVEAIERVFKKGRFATIDVSNQPIESSAAQVIELIRRRFGQDARRSTRRSE
jgi:regulator of PEP synthase PpsR (kinase-PPPase family)